MRFSLLPAGLALSAAARSSKNQFLSVAGSYSLSTEQAFSWTPSQGTVINAINVVGDTNNLENIQLVLDEAQCVSHSTTAKDPTTGQPLCIAFNNNGSGMFGGSEAKSLVVGNAYHFQLTFSKSDGSNSGTSNSAQFTLDDGSPQASTTIFPSSAPSTSSEPSTSPDSPTSSDSSPSATATTSSDLAASSTASTTTAQSTATPSPSAAASVTKAKAAEMPVKTVVGISVASGATAIALIGLLFFCIRARQRASRTKTALGASNLEDRSGEGFVSPRADRGLLVDDFYMREKNIPQVAEFVPSPVDTTRYIDDSPPPQRGYVQPAIPAEYHQNPYPSDNGRLSANFGGMRGHGPSPSAASRRSSVFALSIIDEVGSLPDLDDPRNMTREEIMRLQDEERRIDEAIAAHERARIDNPRGWR